jgi:hypothetical protein
MQQTTSEQLAWARDRLAGKPWASNCSALFRDQAENRAERNDYRAGAAIYRRT